MSLTIYAEFADPLGWIASLRADALILAGDDIQWRAVIAQSRLTVVSTPPGEGERARQDEVTQWHTSAALPGEPREFPWPRAIPWAGPPVSAFAEAVGAGVSHGVRRLLFASYWRRGVDIGNPDVLRALLAVPILHGDSPWEALSDTGYAVAINGGPMTMDAWRRIRQWRADWEELGRPEVPAVVYGGRTLAGFEAVDYLGALVSEAGGEVRPTNPHVLPPMPVAARRMSLDRPGLRPAWWDA